MDQDGEQPQQENQEDIQLTDMSVEEKDFYRLMVEGSLDVISLLDSEGRILFQSPSTEEMLGYKPEELVGQSVLSFVHPDDLDTATQRLQNLFESIEEKERLVVRFLHRNGEYRRIEVRGRMVESEVIRAVVINSRDVTDRQQVLENLQQSNELFQAAFHASSDMCSIVQWSNGRFIDVNESWEKTSGWSRAEVINKTVPDFDIWERPDLLAEITEELSSKGSINQHEATIVNRRGEQLDVIIAGKIVDISGVECVYISLTNVTDLRKLEAQLRQSQKMEALGQLTGGIAHDFNNLLSVILGNAELLSELATDTDNSIGEVITSLVAASQRGAQLTQQLLAFSRKQNLEPKVVDPKVVVCNAISLLEVSLGKEIKIGINSMENLWHSKLDPNQLETTILNLAINARDAMSDIGRLDIKLRNESVSAKNARPLDLDPGDYVRIEVSDTGTGIDAAIIGRVFEPFYTTKGRDKGTGLGLSMVFGFARQSDGNVTIESESGVGTTVTLWLPRTSEKIESIQSETDNDRQIVTGRKVLLVEDDRDVRVLTARLLSRMGFEVHEAESGEQVQSMLTEEPGIEIDLVISDVRLPGIDGPQTARMIRHRHQEVPVLFMSGYSEGLDLDLDGNVHNVAYISKPFKVDALASKIQSLLR